ncbi:GspH/FimT family pseudopilin [Gudongella sp. DL1XJH-153]|uniref:GspH/FimT family pseudopilin n=1 Tax=Gudongella sp. DL1XJH-153 TaxID=3409804 RepID=UPI003BB51A4B
MALLIDRNSFKKGYTLIELIVVVALFALLLAITLPNSAIIRNLNERQELRMIEKDLRQARNKAILENRLIDVSFYVDGNQYIIQYSESEKIKVHKLKSGLRIFYAGTSGFRFNGTGRVGNSNTVTLKKSDGRTYHIAVGVNTTEITLREVK